MRSLLMVCAAVVSYAADPFQPKPGCTTRLNTGSASVLINATVGTMGGQDAVQFTVVRAKSFRDDDDDDDDDHHHGGKGTWVGLSLAPSMTNSEMYISYWDTSVDVGLYNYYSYGEETPRTASGTPAIQSSSSNTMNTFYRRAATNATRSQSIPINQEIYLAWAKGSGKPGESWTKHTAKNVFSTNIRCS